MISKNEHDHEVRINLLARAYALILSWPNPNEKNNTAVSDNADHDTKTAIENVTDDKSAATI